MNMQHTARCGLVALAWLLASCSVGHGSGEITGTVSVPQCRPEGEYELRPTSFLAESAEQVLELRLQRGSDTEMLSDGVSLLVDDAAAVETMLLNQDIPVAIDADPRIDLTFYLNATCPADRDQTPVVLSAVSGSVRFSHIYAPRVNKSQVRIAAELSNVRFEDPRTDQRWAVLNGSFDFLYVRGSPAQRFP
ncbi:MAG: hypothetical protein JWN04_6693 [Myxococcaceae bacterium]|nr:hypothetical protein [Myxococcaceae bacterium]